MSSPIGCFPLCGLLLLPTPEPFAALFMNNGPTWNSISAFIPKREFGERLFPEGQWPAMVIVVFIKARLRLNGFVIYLQHLLEIISSTSHHKSIRL